MAADGGDGGCTSGCLSTPLRRLLDAKNVSACQHANSFIEASTRLQFTLQQANYRTPVCSFLSAIGERALLVGAIVYRRTTVEPLYPYPQWGDERAEKVATHRNGSSH